jgi:hypothetical protein
LEEEIYMEPISATIVAAIAGGAAVALKDVANKAVTDAYQGIKTVIIARYKCETSIKALEEKPKSSTAQKLLAEGLEETKAVEDNEVIELAKKLSEALSQIPKEKAEDYAIDIERFKAANATFKDIQTSGKYALRINDTEVRESFVIESIKTGTSNEDYKKKE